MDPFAMIEAYPSKSTSRLAVSNCAHAVGVVHFFCLLVPGTPLEIVVTWTTYHHNDTSYVQYGATQLNQIAHGSRVLFVDGGPLKRKHYIHRVLLSNLTPFTRYRMYRYCTLSYLSMIHNDHTCAQLSQNRISMWFRYFVEQSVFIPDTF